MNENNVKVLEFNAENTAFTGLVNGAKEHKNFNQIIEMLKLDGYTISDNELSVNELSAKEGDKTISAFTVTQKIKKDGQEVGEAVFLSTNEETYALSTVRVDGGKADLHYEEDGKIVRRVVENNDIEGLMTKTECKLIVGSICSGGFAGSVSGCIAGCLTFGPASPVCWLICNGLVAAGCYYGANAACAWAN